DVDGDQNTAEEVRLYFNADQVGSIVAVTGPDETIVEHYEYMPYGEVTIKDGQGTDLNGTSAILNPFMFTARRYDEETGLYHYRHRAYDPVVGRFLQRDPLGYVDGPCLHEYASSSPLAATDPRGLSPEMDPQEDPALGANPPFSYFELNGILSSRYRGNMVVFQQPAVGGWVIIEIIPISGWRRVGPGKAERDVLFHEVRDITLGAYGWNDIDLRRLRRILHFYRPLCSDWPEEAMLFGTRGPREGGAVFPAAGVFERWRLGIQLGVWNDPNPVPVPLPGGGDGGGGGNGGAGGAGEPTEPPAGSSPSVLPPSGGTPELPPMGGTEATPPAQGGPIYPPRPRLPPQGGKTSRGGESTPTPGGGAIYPPTPRNPPDEKLRYSGGSLGSVGAGVLGGLM
ncbi:MAG: hypothetical protein GF328_07680, partial [Candidatus Latescibacteria bacterium]|nr:hypothetical protein [Candidatus Latescibacterota bacterium]